ncbi:MAG: hypothetical protein H6807_03975 [Planctomycetes bacterium]|nr:hypothetical protein [Planctomycetota bacterium]
MNTKIEASGPVTILDNWSLQEVDLFLRGARGPSDVSSWVWSDEGRPRRLDGVAGVIQLDCLFGLIEHLVLSERLVVMKSWMSSWYQPGSKLGILVEGEGAPVTGQDMEGLEAGSKWRRLLTEDPALRHLNDQGCRDYRAGQSTESSYWSQVIEGMTSYLGLSQSSRRSYLPHPIRVQYLESTAWKKRKAKDPGGLQVEDPDGLQVKDPGGLPLGHVNRVIHEARLRYVESRHRDRLSRKLVLAIPAVSLLCLAEASSATGMIEMALQLRQDEEFRRLRQTLHEIGEAVDRGDLDRVGKEGAAFAAEVDAVERRLGLGQGSDRKGLDGDVETSTLARLEVAGPKADDDPSPPPRHYGSITRVLAAASIDVAAQLRRKLGIDDPRVLDQYNLWAKRRLHGDAAGQAASAT